jgi:hypothetical protein
MFCDSGALIIGHDPSASAVRGYLHTEWREDRTSFNIGLRVNEMAFILGDIDYFVKKYLAEEESKRKLIVLLHSPISSMINLDIRLCAMMLAEKLPGATILPMETNGNRYYDAGLSMAFVETLKLAQQENVSAIPGSVNILGLNTLDYPDAADRAALKAAISATGRNILAIFGMETDIERIKQALCAESNMVVSASGIDVARWMREHWGIPYSVITDGFSTMEQPGRLWHAEFAGQVVRTIQERRPVDSDQQGILIIGEQISSNLLRQSLRVAGASQVTVAGWFLMDDAFMEDADIRITSETELVGVMNGQRWQVIIADPVFRELWNEEPGSVYCERSHPPVSSLRRDRGGRGGGSRGSDRSRSRGDDGGRAGGRNRGYGGKSV